MPDYGLEWSTASQAVAVSIGEACLTIAFPIMVYGLITRFRRHRDDINSQLGVVASAGMIVAMFYGYPIIVRTMNNAMKEFGQEQSKIVSKALKNSADRILLPTEEVKAAEFSQDQFDASPFWNAWEAFWQDAKKTKLGFSTLVDSVSITAKYILWKIGDFVHYAMDFVQEYLLKIFICLSPIPLAMLLLPQTERVGVKFMSYSLGLILWRLGYVFADLITLELGDTILLGVGAALVGKTSGLTISALAAGSSVWVFTAQGIIAVFTTIALLICILHIGIPIAIVKIISGGDPVGSFMGAVGIGQQTLSMGMANTVNAVVSTNNPSQLQQNQSQYDKTINQGQPPARPLEQPTAQEQPEPAAAQSGPVESAPVSEPGNHSEPQSNGETALTAASGFGSYACSPFNGFPPETQAASLSSSRPLLNSIDMPALGYADYPALASAQMPHQLANTQTPQPLSAAASYQSLQTAGRQQLLTTTNSAYSNQSGVSQAPDKSGEQQMQNVAIDINAEEITPKAGNEQQ